jgi:hypothetical protein
MSEKTYYEDEMRRILPVDEYGISIQIKTSSGSTKWLTLNAESFQAFNAIIVPTLFASPQKG